LIGATRANPAKAGDAKPRGYRKTDEVVVCYAGRVAERNYQKGGDE
jgi:hypothetical protein